jgi:peptidoglycan L-alanyl-D-glutamate endopeptidase CwlK
MEPLEKLEPGTRALAIAAFAAWARAGILLRPTQTLRSYAEQDALYAQGRTLPGHIVTHAPGGYSWHNHARAFDVAELDKTPYELGMPGPQDDDALWEFIGDIGEQVGLEWGGRWKFQDKPHFQHTAGLTLAQARLQHDQPHLA